MTPTLTPVAFNVLPDMVHIQLRVETGYNPILLNGSTWPAYRGHDTLTVINAGTGRLFTAHGRELDPETPDGLVNLMFAVFAEKYGRLAEELAAGWEEGR